MSAEILQRNITSLKKLGKHFSFIIRLWRLQPFTARGAIALVLSITTLRFIALPESDLVANMIASALLGLLVIALVLGAVFKTRLKNHLEAEVYFDLNNPLSHKELSAGIVLHQSNIPPFYYLKIDREFDHQGVNSRTHLVKGQQVGPTSRHLVDTIIFPHRGLWTLKNLNLSLNDAWGLTKFNWEITTNIGLEVSAPTIAIKPLPIVASSSRSGDQLSLSHERTGDLYDIKQYDPSDGIKKILWKTFAKSGQLVVRRPEPAIVPEGELALYLVAGATDDHVAGCLQSYLDLLFDNNITVIFGTDGLSSFCNEKHQIQKAINCSVWNEQSGTGLDFNTYLTNLGQANYRPEKIIIFGPAHNSQWFNAIEKTATANQLNLVLAIVENRLNFKQHSQTQKRDSLRELNLNINRAGAEMLLCEEYEQINSY